MFLHQEPVEQGELQIMVGHSPLFSSQVPTRKKREPETSPEAIGAQGAGPGWPRFIGFP